MLSGQVPGQDYGQFLLRCGHSPFYYLGWERNNPFCGLCSLKLLMENEVPGRIHTGRRSLADNGNPATDPRMWAHLEAVLGLVPPKPGEDLHQYRLARGRLYGTPNRNLFPTTYALWVLMGYQPKLAAPLVRIIFGRDLLQVAIELNMTRFGAHQAIAKGIRATHRNIKEYVNYPVQIDPEFDFKHCAWCKHDFVQDLKVHQSKRGAVCKDEDACLERLREKAS